MTAKQVVISVMLLALTAVTLAASGAGTVTAADIIARLNAVVGGFSDLTGTLIVQTYKDGAVSRTQEIEITLQQPDKMRLEYIAPAYLAGNVTIIVGNKMWMYIAAISKWYEKDLSTLSPAAQPWLLFRHLLRGVHNELDDYKFIRLKNENDAYHLRGVPANTAAIYGEIDLWVNAQTFVLARRTLYDMNGHLLADTRFLAATKLSSTVMLPLRIETYNGDGKLLSVVHYAKIAVNTGVPATLFAPPEKTSG